VPLRGPSCGWWRPTPGWGSCCWSWAPSWVGCAGALDGVDAVGDDRSPDPQAVRALRPDAIVTGTADGRYDLADPALLGRLRDIAPTVAVDLGRRAASAADLRALLGSVQPPPLRSRGRHED
jgi:ABC-type Fe3+-hydroxamate transport system substrate-binding protein